MHEHTQAGFLLCSKTECKASVMVHTYNNLSTWETEEDCHVFKTSLGHTVSSKPVRATKEDPVSDKQKIIVNK